MEFTFLLDEWLAKHDLRSKTEIQYLFLLPRVFPIESVAEAVTPLLEERHIGQARTIRDRHIEHDQIELLISQGRDAAIQVWMRSQVRPEVVRLAQHLPHASREAGVMLD